jgi:ATP-dependent helicase/nuclease subunit B
LPLEAAMLAQSAFEEPNSGAAHDFTYVRLTGQTVAGEEREIDLKGKSAADIAREALDELKQMIERFEDELQPYRPGMHPKFRRRPDGEYDHLARLAEWGLSPDQDEAPPE